jgi:hypothetical protein
MCAPCYAATSTSVATQGTRTFDECVTFVDEVHELSLVQWVGRIGRLSCFLAPRAECLICLCFSAARPPRTSRLLSCHRSVGGLLLAVPARCFAKLRSDKNQTKHPGSRFRAGSLQSICRVCGGRTCIKCREIDRSQDAGAAAAVSVLCRWKARGRQEDGSRSDVVCPVLWIADERADMEISTRMTRSGLSACAQHLCCDLCCAACR